MSNLTERLRSQNIKITTTRLAFQSFSVVRQEHKNMQKVL